MPVTDLLFVRHAHAGNALGWDGPDDLRPLTAKGLRQATRLGGLLAAADIHPDVLLSSAGSAQSRRPRSSARRSVARSSWTRVLLKGCRWTTSG